MNHLTEAKRYLKRILKGKIGITQGLVVAFAITGGIAVQGAENLEEKALETIGAVIIRKTNPSTDQKSVVIGENQVIEKLEKNSNSGGNQASAVYIDKDQIDAIVINNGTIDIKDTTQANPGSGGVASNTAGMFAKAGTIINNGIIKLEGYNGMRAEVDDPKSTSSTTYATEVTIENGKNGQILNSGNYGMYARIRGGRDGEEFADKLITLVNRGTVANMAGNGGNGDRGIHAEIVNNSSVVTNNGTINVTNAATGIVKNEGSYGVAAKIDTDGSNNTVNLINEGIIENDGNYGIHAEVTDRGENNTISVINTGTIKNGGETAVYLGNGVTSFENHGTIAPQGGSTAIDIRDYRTKLILGTKSAIDGNIKAVGNTLYLVRTKDHDGNGTLSGNITGLGNLIAKDGDWTLNGNIELGHTNALKIGYEEIRDAEGNITIEDGTIKMIITSGQQPVLAGNKISISQDGGIKYQVAESAYMASKSVSHLTSISFKEIEGEEYISFDPLLEEAGKKIGSYTDANGVVHLIMYDNTMDWDKIKEAIDAVVGAAPEPGPDPEPNPEPDPIPPKPTAPILVGGYKQSIEAYTQSNVDEVASSLLNTKGMDNFRLNAINPDKAKLNNQYAEVLISYGKYDGSGNNTGYDYTSRGVAGGTYREIAPGFNLGIGYGYLKSEIDYDDSVNTLQPTSTENIDTFEIDLYASYRVNNFLFNGYGSYSYNRHDLDRNVYDTVGKVYETSKSEFDSNIFKMGGEAGYIFNMDSFYIYPYAGIASKWYSRDSYNESQTTSNGANNYSMKVGKTDYQTFLTTLGLIAGRETSRERFVGRIAWDYQFDGRDSFDGKFNDANIDNTWSIQGLKENKNLLKASLGYACKFTPSFEAGVTLLLQANGEYQDKSAGVNINYKF